ncbi:KH domain-containing protein [Hirschfeldia incana]|nr:KH domain-containing protein [Hirschfeldia incana]
MAEEDVIAFPVQPSDHKRKLENVESEILEQHPGSIDQSNEAKEASEYSQAKRPKLDGDAEDVLGVGNNVESKKESGEERPEESKEEGAGGNLVEKVQEPIHAEGSENKMGDNGKPEDNHPAPVEAAASQGVSVEENNEVNTSASQKEAEDNSKETNDAVVQKEVENESKEVDDDDDGSQKENKEANAGGCQEKTGDESKEEVGDGSKEVNGGSSQKEVDDTQSTSRKIEVPSSKVGTLIGKGGEMVRNLQLSSGAKIQIRRDSEADPNAALRPVEIIGNLASIEKAEKLINEVIAQSDAGGVPALFVRGAPEQIEIKVPNDKVGVIIGRGGETIKNMQMKSRARIQLIPLEEGDGSKERTVRISGDKRQIDIATALIKDCMYQDTRPPHYSGGYNSPAYHPRGPGGPPQWGGSRGPHGPHSMPYNYHHGGPYPSHGSHYRPPNSGGYPPQHMPPRSGYGPGWEQRPPHSGPYDYYSRQGPQNPGPVPNHPAPYSQPGGQQNYGQMYDQPNYDNPPMQQSYGQYGGSQQGYPPAGGQHQMQQPSRPYGMQGPAEQGYGPPRPAAPSVDVPYQGPPQAAPSYGTSMAPPQQQYGYASTTPGQQTYPSYSSAAPSDGYNGTQTAAAAPAYEQLGVPPASGVQQTSAAYGQAPPTGGYSSYPSTQPAYGNAPAQSNGNYGYGSQYPSYGGGNASGYAAPVGQTAYSQTAPAQAGYDQSATQPAGYAAAPGTAQ